MVFEPILGGRVTFRADGFYRYLGGLDGREGQVVDIWRFLGSGHMHAVTVRFDGFGDVEIKAGAMQLLTNLPALRDRRVDAQ